jgi:hypothetical protein
MRLEPVTLTLAVPKSVKFCLATLLLLGLAQGQSAQKKQPTAVKTQRLSTYMRDAGLLYIETLEDAMSRWTDADAVPPERGNFGQIAAATDARHDRSERQFKLLEKLENRIEIRANAKADKEFYAFGLQTLKSISILRASAFYSWDVGSTHAAAIGEPNEPDNPTWRKVKQCEQVVYDLLKPWATCSAWLKTTIKSGEFNRDEIIASCKYTLMTCP